MRSKSAKSPVPLFSGATYSSRTLAAYYPQSDGVDQRLSAEGAPSVVSAGSAPTQPWPAHVDS